MKQNQKLIEKQLSTQRIIAIRVASAYRTISGDVVRVTVVIDPIDFLIKERAANHGGTPRREEMEALVEEWQRRWGSSIKGHFASTSGELPP